MWEGLNDEDIGVACLISMPSMSDGGGAGDKMSHAAHWAVDQFRKSREVVATNGLHASMCV
jgi:hypothetical protein